MKKSSPVPIQYFLVLVVIFFSIVIIEGITSERLVSNLANALFLTLLVLVVYSIGVSCITRKIPDEASRFTALRIFMIIMIGIGAFLALAAWIDDPPQIVLALGIIWGAIVISLRDLIQNMVGSLMLLITGMYRIGDHIRIRGICGQVMDIGIFRTTLMELDHDAGDRPTGEIMTIPNGILFRETVTNTSRQISVISDEIRITLPFSADLKDASRILIGTIERHTASISQRAEKEISALSEKKYLAGFETRPSINYLLSDYGVVIVARYITDAADRAAIKSEIVADFSHQVQGIMDAGQPATGGSAGTTGNTQGKW